MNDINIAISNDLNLYTNLQIARLQHEMNINQFSNYETALSNHNILLNNIDNSEYVGAVDVSMHDNHNISNLNSLPLHQGDFDDFNDDDIHTILPIIVNDQNISNDSNMDIYSNNIIPTYNHQIDMNNAPIHLGTGGTIPGHLLQQLNLENMDENSISSNIINKLSRSKSNNKNRNKIVSPEMKSILLEKNRIAQRKYRQKLSDEKRLKTLEKNKEAHKRYRESLTPEQQAIAREKNRLAQKKRRESQSLEEKKLIKEKNRVSQKLRRESVSGRDSSISSDSTNSDYRNFNLSTSNNINQFYNNLNYHVEGTGNITYSSRSFDLQLDNQSIANQPNYS